MLASAFGWIPTLGARLARATFEPDLLISDGEAYLVANPLALGSPDAEKTIEGWLPFRSVFDMVASGRRHVMMGASQIDRFGNQNISCIGDWSMPKAQLIGVRGAPGNTINHPTSYWVPNHSPRVFVPNVDFVSGVGYSRAAEAKAVHHEIRGIVTNLAVLDFETPDRSMRLRSLHPGVSVDEVVAATGFPLVIPGSISPTRTPTDDDLALIREVLDPAGLRKTEVK